MGHQKHPVQLAPLTDVPLGETPEPEAVAAYRQRYDLHHRIREPHYIGWTLPCLLLAAAADGDSQVRRQRLRE